MYKRVEDDSFSAMCRVEQRLALGSEEEPDKPAIQEDERTQLLALSEQLSEPELSPQARLSLVAVMRVLLGRTAPVECSLAAVEVSSLALPP